MKTIIVTSKMIMSVACSLKNYWLDMADIFIGLIMIMVASLFTMSWCVNGFDRYILTILESFNI
jgi:hypothetical protein